MLFVKTYIDKSDISGIGLFAAEAIEKDTLIWKLTDLDLVIREEELQSKDLTSLQRKYIETYSYTNGSKYYFCIDDAKFMNHSRNANTYEVGHSSLASRDIKAGEEITCNYGNFDDSKKDLPYCQTNDPKAASET